MVVLIHCKTAVYVICFCKECWNMIHGPRKSLDPLQRLTDLSPVHRHSSKNIATISYFAHPCTHNMKKNLVRWGKIYKNTEFCSQLDGQSKPYHRINWYGVSETHLAVNKIQDLCSKIRQRLKAAWNKVQQTVNIHTNIYMWNSNCHNGWDSNNNSM